jgi:prepilin-type processing-associated H-X9-DG protein
METAYAATSLRAFLVAGLGMAPVNRASNMDQTSSEGAQLHTMAFSGSNNLFADGHGKWLNLTAALGDRTVWGRWPTPPLHV